MGCEIHVIRLAGACGAPPQRAWGRAAALMRATWGPAGFCGSYLVIWGRGRGGGGGGRPPFLHPRSASLVGGLPLTFDLDALGPAGAPAHAPGKRRNRTPPPLPEAASRQLSAGVKQGSRRASGGCVQDHVGQHNTTIEGYGGPSEHCAPAPSLVGMIVTNCPTVRHVHTPPPPCVQ